MAIEQLESLELDEELKSHLKTWGIQGLTSVQRMALKGGVANGVSMVVCAPTSSGKTLAAEIAVLKALEAGKRCIYLVSHKALADQKYIDFEQRFGFDATKPLASVGLSTGDREEGDPAPQLLVSTYEKALAQLLSGQIDPSSALVVADELQIIGESGRGPNIETLCAVLRQRNLYQLVALTATVGNPNELADWFECDLVECRERDIVLNQEIWYQGSAYSVQFGEEDGEEIVADRSFPSDPIGVAKTLLEMGRGPVLVFTESRNEASRYAETLSQGQSRSADGVQLAEQLDLFSEPTEASEQLQANAQRRVAFHTADLTPQERQVVEQGFLASTFDVCFATSTLAAGVNFPFQSVVFPKLTYEWGPREGSQLTRSDYRNMSGRAGRLGMHLQGYSVLVPANPKELRWANELVLPENDRVSSKLVSLSMRRTVLTLVASGVVKEQSGLRSFFENTYFWYQISEHNPRKLDEVIDKANHAVDWLATEALIEKSDDVFIPTPLGKAVAQSGLLPTTATSFRIVLQKHRDQLETDFDALVAGLIHWICTCTEFRGDAASRFLVFPSARNPVTSTGYLKSQQLLAPFDFSDNQANQCAHALILYAQGVAERKIRVQTNIASGGVHRMAVDVAWVLDGLQRISSAPELDCPQTLSNKLGMLARRVRWGAPPEILDIIRVAQKSGVPGFGRQRAMALFAQGLATFDAILSSGKDKILAVLRNERRTDALLEALTSSIAFGGERYARIHQAVAATLGLSEIVRRCEEEIGVDYEEAIKSLLESESQWVITVLDDGKQQNVPDLLIRLGDHAILLECKTTTKKVPLIKKEEAFAVLQKAVDFDNSFHKVTLGKPAFDEHSKKKVQAAKDITLVEHAAFMEGVLRVLSGSVSPEEFLSWLSCPGLAEIDRLGGERTIDIVQRRA